MNSASSIRLHVKKKSHVALINEFPIYPGLGIVGTIIGTLFALVLIPEDPYPAGALYQSGLVMTSGLAFAPFVAALRSPKTILRAEHLLVLSPIFWLLLDLLQSVYSLTFVSRASVQGAFVAIGLFVIMIWLTTLTRPWALPKALQQAAKQPLSSTTIFSIILALFCLGMFKYALASSFNPSRMVYYLGQARWSAPWARGTLGGWESFLDHTSYFGYLLPTLTVLLANRTRWLNGRVAVSLSLSLIMVAFLSQSGDRRTIGVVIGAAVITWMLEQRAFGLRKSLIAVGCVVCLLFVMQTMLIYRNIGFNALISGTLDNNMYEDHLHIDDNFLRLCQIIYFVPEQYPFVYMQQIVFALARPIPRVFWPGKPTSPGFDLTAANGQSGFSLSSTVIGEWYLSFGWLGIIFGGWLYGRFATSLSELLKHNTFTSEVIVYSLGVLTLFAGMRSMLELVSMSYTILAWILVSQFVSDKR